MADRLKILLAESDPDTIRSLTAAFQQQGWEALAASEAAAALATARKSRPDAVVLDTRLASGGSLITLKRLRAAVDTAAIPVILIGSCTAEQKQEFLAAGVQQHLEAPADAEAVCAAVRQQLAPPQVVLQAPAEVLQNPLRLAALKASGLMDSPPEESFDRVTRLAARLLVAPSALLSLVGEDRQFFKSQVGLSDPWATSRESPLSHSFCQWVVCGREAVTVNDARQHPVLRDNLAIQKMGVIAYTGVPIFTANGEALGSLCAIDARPRTWSAHDQAVMHDLARLAESSVAYAELVRNPPRNEADFDHYVEAAGGAISGALGILRRDEAALEQADRHLLYGMIEEYGNHLVQLNRLIHVSRALS